MPTYKAAELPNIDDPDLVRCCVIVQGMGRRLTKFIGDVIEQLTRHPVTVPTRVALAGVNRVTEGALSIELLCMKNRVRDAAILLLSLWELSLDLQCIALDPKRAATWIDHAKENTKPWKVASQLEEIYTDPRELDVETALYRQYSMVKHCNPVGGVLTFPMTVTPDTLELDMARNNSPFIRCHLFGLGICLHRVGSAASRIWTDRGLNPGTVVSELEKGVASLSQSNVGAIEALLQEWAEQSKYADPPRT